MSVLRQATYERSDGNPPYRLPCGRPIQQSKKFWPLWREDTGPKAIAATLSLNYSYIRRLLAGIHKEYGVHKTCELLLMIDAVVPSIRPTVRLTPRGKEVLELYMRGHTYREIAERLGMGIGGVRRHLEKMRWQNDCESMLELIAKYHCQSKFAKNGRG